MIRIAILRLRGQPFGGPSDVEAQSTFLRSAPISPPPVKNPKSVSAGRRAVIENPLVASSWRKPLVTLESRPAFPRGSFPLSLSSHFNRVDFRRCLKDRSACISNGIDEDRGKASAAGRSISVSVIDNQEWNRTSFRPFDWNWLTFRCSPRAETANKARHYGGPYLPFRLRFNVGGWMT